MHTSKFDLCFYFFSSKYNLCTPQVMDLPTPWLSIYDCGQVYVKSVPYFKH